MEFHTKNFTTPNGTLERFSNRKITTANKQAGQLGIEPGMNAADAMALIA
jgi:uncharacterized protein YunC (DUF1805 family)